MRIFDAIIIGAGQAGPSLAGRLDQAGLSVAIIERHLVGGTCVNTGCKPTKTLVASAYAIHMAQRGDAYGFKVAGAIDVDMTAVAARAAKVIDDSRAGNETWLAGMENVELIRGHARFEGPHVVAVNGERLTAPRIFINVGGRAAVPDMPGVNDVPILTNTEIVALDTLPRHLVVVGGSYIGLEFAQMFAASARKSRSSNEWIASLRARTPISQKRCEAYWRPRGSPFGPDPTASRSLEAARISRCLSNASTKPNPLSPATY